MYHRLKHKRRIDAVVRFGRIETLIEGAEEGYVEIEGSPDMVLEIVSDSSVKKDKKRLPKLYWEAGINEYWLVDVRGNRQIFDIYRHSAKGFVQIRKKDDWVKSTVFGKSFMLSLEADEFGQPEYTLEMR